MHFARVVWYVILVDAFPVALPVEERHGISDKRIVMQTRCNKCVMGLYKAQAYLSSTIKFCTVRPYFQLIERILFIVPATAVNL